MKKIAKNLKEKFELKCIIFITLLITTGILLTFFVSFFREITSTSRLLLLIFGIFLIVYFSRLILQRFLISPIKSLEDVAQALSKGNFSLKSNINTNDEIGRLAKALNHSSNSLENIFKRVKSGSDRVSEVAKKVDEELKNLSENTRLEAEAIANIASSLEEMSSASQEISINTENLAASTEEKAASLEEMVTSISEVTNLAEDLSHTIDSISASIEELSSTIKEVAKKTEDLTGASEETLAATEEILSSIKEVEQRAKDSAKLSEKVKIDASTFGITSVEKTIEGIQNIKASFDRTANFIKKLSSRSEEIGKILNVIDDITDQTTLLALNAAILASQAGEHGKGFSVVADEIKDLAERTSVSTREIADLIRAVQQEVKDATSAMDEGLVSVEEGLKVARHAGDALQKIVESSIQSAEMSLSIERSTAEQAKTTKLVSDAMEQVKNMVSQVAKATSEQSKGARLLTIATERMRDVANHVKSATAEQLINIKDISKSIEEVSGRSHLIAKAISEQKYGSQQIFNSIEKIKHIPKNTVDTIAKINQSLKGLLNNVELLSKELEFIKLHEENLKTEIIRFGVEPVDISPVEVSKRFSPLADFLHKKTGKNFEIKAYSDYKGALRDLGQGITQMFFLAPTTFVEANNKYGVEVIAKLLMNGGLSSRSVIISKNNGKVNSIEDIKGCNFAFGDAHSFSCYIAPRIIMLDAGIDLNDLLHYQHLDSQTAIVEGILRGEFDAGAVLEDIAYTYKNKGIKVIEFSEKIPPPCICVSKSFPENYKSQIKKVLTSLSDKTHEGSHILGSISKHYKAFVDASESDYASVKVMMKRLNLV